MMKKSILDKLGNTDLAWPIGLKKYIRKKRRQISRTGTYYVNTLQIWNHKLLMRTFAFRIDSKFKNDKIEIQEVCRRLEGEKEVLVCQIENKYLYGRTVYFTDNGKWITNDDNVYYSWYKGNHKYWYFYDFDMFDLEAWISKLNIPYCGYNSTNYKYRIPFFHYYELYKKYPKIEFLAKAGYDHLITGARYLNFKGKTFEQIFKISSYWKHHIKKLYIQDILLIRRFNINDFSELRMVKSIRLFAYIKKHWNTKTYKYVSKLNNEYGIYNDYLSFAEQIGVNMDDNKIIYPINVREAHDDFEKKVVAVKSEIVNKGIKKKADKLKKYIYENDGLIIMPAEDNQILINESKELMHCVRTYAEQMAEGKTGIMLIRNIDAIDKPFVTLELKGKQVIQARAYKNDFPQANVVDFIRQWEKRFKLTGY